MSQYSKEAVEALENAILLEKEGLRAYLEYAKDTEEVSGKNMFILLALDEYDHMMILEKVLLGYLKDKPMPKINRANSSIYKVIPKIKDIANYPGSQSTVNQVHALEMALKFESKVQVLYEDLAKTTKNEDATAVFLTLAEMEKDHYDLLDAQRNSIAHTGQWIDAFELGMEYME